METVASVSIFFAFIFGGWEVVLVFAMVLILLGAKRLPELCAGLRMGLLEFRRATDDVRKATEDAMEEKESGLVHEALTTDNRTVEFVYPHAEGPGLYRSLVLFVAQGFGVGRLPFAPGTFGSLVGLVWFVLLVGTTNYWVYLAGTFVSIGLAVWLCGAAEQLLKQTDPSSVVLDEIVAVPICFLPWITKAWLGAGTLPSVATLFSGSTALMLVAAFVLFRLFDISKPWPIRQSQHLRGGWGMVADDLLAALYVALILTPFA